MQYSVFAFSSISVAQREEQMSEVCCHDSSGNRF